MKFSVYLYIFFSPQLFLKNKHSRTSLLALISANRASSPASSGLGVLSTHLDSPPVAETTVRAHVLQSLQVLTELGVEDVSSDLRVLAGADVLLSVQEPLRDLELERVLDDGNEALNLVRLELSSALVDVDFRLLADEVRESATASLDSGQREHHLLATINVGVEDTQDVLEIRARDERHFQSLDGNKVSLLSVSPVCFVKPQQPLIARLNKTRLFGCPPVEQDISSKLLNRRKVLGRIEGCER